MNESQKSLLRIFFLEFSEFLKTRQNFKSSFLFILQLSLHNDHWCNNSSNNNSNWEVPPTFLYHTFFRTKSSSEQKKTKLSCTMFNAAKEQWRKKNWREKIKWCIIEPSVYANLFGGLTWDNTSNVFWSLNIVNIYFKIFFRVIVSNVNKIIQYYNSNKVLDPKAYPIALYSVRTICTSWASNT